MRGYENRIRRDPSRLPGLTPAPCLTFGRSLPPSTKYIVDGARYKELDLYHGFRPGLPLPLLRRIPSVMTVDNLNFLRYPHLYSLPERLVLLRLYRRALRSASRLITVNRDAREELSERLRIDPGRIEVVMPLAARVPHEPPAGAQLEAVRRKYMLPAEFILMLGTVEERHNHKVLFEAVGSLGERERAIRAEGLGAAQREAVAADPELPGLAAGRARGWGAATAAGRGGIATGMRGETPADAAVPPAASSAERVGIVVCGRRAVYADSPAGYARGRHMASRVDFIYELSPRRPAGAVPPRPCLRLPARCRDRGVDRAVVEGDACQVPMVQARTSSTVGCRRRRGLCPP